MLEQFKAVGNKALQELKGLGDGEALEQFRLKYLSRKGEITSLLSQLGKLPKELRPQAGQLANTIKNEVNDAFEELKQQLQGGGSKKSQAYFDVTLPGKKTGTGWSASDNAGDGRTAGAFRTDGFRDWLRTGS